MFISETYRTRIREALRLALPIIAGQLGQVLMGFFDSVQVGGLGSIYIAASGFANTVYWTLNLLGLGILFAVSPLVSEAFGEKKNWKAIGIFRSGLKVSLIVSVVFTVLVFVLINYLHLFKESETVNALAAKYLRVLNYSTVFMLLFTVGKQFFDGMGRTTVGMVLTFIGLVLNIFLNWVLIYGHLGMKPMGIEGAALATCTARMVMAGGILVFLPGWDDISKLYEKYFNLPSLIFPSSYDFIFLYE